MSAGHALLHRRWADMWHKHLDGSLGAGSTGVSPAPVLIRRASSKAAIASAVTGVPVFVARLFVFRAPPDHSALEVDVRPADRQMPESRQEIV